jgi:hypothetical protein
MATQGQRRAQAIGAMRALRKLYRTLDTTGEKMERELDRLVKRKTLIGPDSLAKTGTLMVEIEFKFKALVKGFGDLVAIIANLPR